MFEVHPSNWPLALGSSGPRDEFHERALHEARIATDHRQAAAPAARTTPARASLVGRLRLALAGSPATTPVDACSCPA